MSPTPPDDDDDDGSDDFLREVARVDERSPPSIARLEGTNIGRFKVVSEIGRGGMGIVFLAEDEKLRRKVALKLLPPSFAADEERRRRFLREARAAAAVSHPNLVTVYDVGEHEGRAYIAMEYLRGRSLREQLSERPLSIDEAIDLARQVLAGLAHAHAAGLLHRDLKPENVLVDRDGRVRLVDFGLAKLDSDIDGPGDNSTRDGLVMGTPGYMSPEQARGQAVDARSDIFSFGVLLYEMLTRKRPFTGPTRADVVTSLLRDAPPRVDVTRPEVGIALGDLVHRCLAKAPDDRFPSSAVLKDALEDAWMTSKRELRVTPTPAEAETPPIKPKAKTWPWLAAAAGIALGGVAITIAQRTPAVVTAAPNDAGARKGIAITDVPLPKSNSPEALASYRQALQAIRDADWAIADERLMDAVKRDPELSAAYLRLAILGGTGATGPASAREQLSRAMGTRSNLSERDQALLMAVEPVINRDPPEKNLARQRLRDLVNARPDDAELWHFYAVFGCEGEDDGIEAERRAVELDPQFADAWQILAAQLARRGQVDEALAAIERCVVISPLTADCRGERARLYGVMGECTRMEEDLRRGLNSNPRASQIWHEDRAAALVAVGRTDDTVLEAFRQKWSIIGDERRKGVEPIDRALLATARGRFAEAEALLAEGEKAIANDSNAQTHARYAGLRIAIAKELGRPKDAAKIAETFIAKKDVWIGSSFSMNTEVPMLRVMQHGGVITQDELTKRRDDWYARARASESGRSGTFLWALAYADKIETAAEGKEAIEALPKDATGGSGLKIDKETFIRAELGNAFLLAGKPDEALPHLEAASNACNWLHWPVQHTHAILHLGQAHEALGQTESACEAYQRVVARWGTAQKSSARDIAKTHLKALSCGTEARRAPPQTAPPAGRSWSVEKDDEDEPDEIAMPRMPPMPPGPPVPPLPPGPPPGALAQQEAARALEAAARAKEALARQQEALARQQEAAARQAHGPNGTKTVTRGAIARGAERGAACAEAKRAAIAKTMCAKQKSVEGGDCECNRVRDEWICAATMAVTCN
jgi:eukaryotic-like serine/threonine-protein kinase